MSALHDMAAELLDTIAGELSDPPTEQFVTVSQGPSVAPSTTGADCGRLTVHVARVAPQAQGRTVRRTQVTFGVTLWRCVTASTNPSADVLAADGLARTDEGAELYAAGSLPPATLLPSFGNCTAVTVGDMVPVGPQGGMFAWFLTLTATLD